VVAAVVSDAHPFDRGVETARAIVKVVLAEHGPDGLAEVTVELSVKLADGLERIAAEEGLPATDLTEVWYGLTANLGPRGTQVEISWPDER
jgi:hypothetical protein